MGSIVNPQPEMGMVGGQKNKGAGELRILLTH